jgi:hypothetical protein
VLRAAIIGGYGIGDSVMAYVNSLGARLGEVQRVRKSTEDLG